MSHSTNESEDEFLCKDQSDSQSFDEGSCGGSFGGRGGGAVLKKGPWTSAEDAILVDYVKKHGEGNWNAVQKHSGLFRCGKSCRLRWANHLRPNLKKGAFTADEERKIVELHAKMGNKWARMAAHLPGRTDNEIKNYWNTRIKRRQRAGLPLYPPDVDFSSLNGSHQIQNSTEFNNEDARHHGFLRGNGFEIPDVMFDSLKANHGVLSCNPPLPGISVGGMLTQGLGSSLNYGFMPTTMRRPKRLRESENLFSGFNGSFTNKVSPFDHFQSDACEKIQRPFALSFPYEPDRKVKNPPPYGAIPGSHALINGNTSTSKPNPGAVKLELPSFQYPETDLGSWETSPLLPSLESFDTVTPSLSSEQVQSNCVSPRNSGLLEALLHESQTLNNAKNQSSDKSPSSSVVTPSDMMDGTNLNLCEAEWENFSNPVSPSVYSECNPINRSSLDDAPPAKPMPGSNVKQESVEHTPVRGVAEKEAPTQLDFSRPDAVLGAGWFGRGFSSYGEDLRMNETSPNQAWGLGFIQWNNMPGFRQISGLP